MNNQITRQFGFTSIPSIQDSTASNQVLSSSIALAGGVTGQSSTTDGLPNDSMMFTTGQTFNNLSSFTSFTPNALSAYSIAQMNGSNTGSGNIGGWSVNPTQISSPNGNVVLSSQNNSITALSGNIGGWMINSNQINSPNQNMILDASQNGIIFYSSGVPTIVIQG